MNFASFAQLQCRQTQPQIAKWFQKVSMADNMRAQRRFGRAPPAAIASALI